MNKSSCSKFLFLLLPAVLFVYILFLLIEHHITYTNLVYNTKTTFTKEIVTGKILFINEYKERKNFLVQTEQGRYLIQTDLYDEKVDILCFGDEVTLEILSKPVNLKNKYEVFLSNSFNIQKIAYLLDVKKCGKNRYFIYRLFNFLYSIADKVRKFIVKTVNDKFKSPLNVLLLRLTLGYEDSELKDIKTYFQDAGVAHVLVVSGLHVGFVYILTLFLLRFIFPNLTLRNVLACIAVIFYMFLTGCSPPVVRAVVIIISIALASMLKQNYSSFHSLVLAAFIILLFSPRGLFSPSFQLSFAACFGIVYFYPYFYSHIRQFLEKTSMVIEYIVKLFVTTVSAQIMVIPLIMFYFNRFSIVSPISNILVVPLACLLLWLSIVFYLLESVLPNFTSVICIVIEIVGTFFLYVVETFAKLPFAKINVLTPDLYQLVVYYIIVLLMSKLTSFKNFLFGLIFGFVTLFNSLDFIRRGSLDITFFDVGSGESILINIKNGKETILIDTGANENVAKFNILPYFYKNNIRKIDHLIITHAHYVHYGGTEYILQNIKLKNFYTTNFFPPWAKDYKNIINLVNEKGILYKIVHTTVSFKIDDVQITIIPNFTNVGLDEVKLVDQNSLFIIVEYKNYVILLTNDLPAEYVVDKLSSINLVDKFLIFQIPRHGKYKEDIEIIKKYTTSLKKTKTLFYVTTGRTKELKVDLQRPNFITGIVGNIELNFGKLAGRIHSIKKTSEGIIVQL